LYETDINNLTLNCFLQFYIANLLLCNLHSTDNVIKADCGNHYIIYPKHVREGIFRPTKTSQALAAQKCR